MASASKKHMGSGTQGKGDGTTGRKPVGASEPVGGPTTDRGAKPAEAELPQDTPASWSEGVPDFTTAAAVGELPPGQPALTQASPDVREAEKPVPELAGSDLQPVAGRDPQGGGPQELIPHAKPEGSSESDPE